MTLDIIFSLLGGLGLFLYGMDSMSRGLQEAAGNKLKGFLRTVTTNRVLGVFSGTVATAIVQSSSVTTVMIVSFVNAGLMALPQAISVILGAHIGTTMTAQIIAFRIQNFALPLIALGAILHLFTRSERLKAAGEAVFGFGILFFGLNLMGGAFDPLHDNQTFQNLFTRFSEEPWLGFLIGLGVTILVQSSSVTTGMTIALALSNLITFEQAVPLILGENIGTTVTANIAAISGSHVAKQAARAHFIVNAIGALLALIFLKPFMALVLAFSPEADTARQIANSHTIFNIATTLFALPFIGAVAAISEYLIFGKKRDEAFYYLDESSLRDPGTALDQVKIALLEMSALALQGFSAIGESVIKQKESPIAKLRAASEKIEHALSRVTEYLEKIGTRRLSHEQSSQIPQYVRILHEIERIRDYEEKIRQVAVHMITEGRKFKPAEKSELKIYFDAVRNLLQKAGSIISTAEKNTSREIIDAYEILSEQKEELRKRSQHRMERHRAGIAAANYYFDIVSSLEEIAKKCRNIASTMLE